MSQLEFDEQKYQPPMANYEPKLGWFHKLLISMHLAKDYKSANLACIVIMLLCIGFTIYLIAN